MKRRYLQTVFILCVALFNAVTGYAAPLLTNPLGSGSAGFLPGGKPTQVYQTNTTALRDASGEYADTLEIPLIGGLSVTARKSRVDKFPKKQFVWSGQIEHPRFSEVFLTTVKGAIVGYVQYDHRFFVLEPVTCDVAENTPLPTPVLTRVSEPNRFAPTSSSTSTSIPPSPPPPTEDYSDTHLDPCLNTNISLLSIYSSDASEEVGCDEVIEARINIAVSQANTAFERADAPARVSVVAHKRMEMDESFVLPVAHGYSALELDKLIPDKAFRKEVFRLRDDNEADMVSFVISDFLQNGIGLPTNPLDYTRVKPLKGGAIGGAGNILKRSQKLEEIRDRSVLAITTGGFSFYTFAHAVGAFRRAS